MGFSILEKRILVRVRKFIFLYLCRHNLVFKLFSLIFNKKISFSVNGIDLIVSELFSHVNESKFYVELGANDGITQSNTKFLELYDGWAGILVEPTPELFEKLLQNRSRKNFFKRAAACSFSNTKNWFKLQYGNLGTTPLDGENDIQDPYLHAINNRNILSKSEETYIFFAPAMTLNSILLEGNAPSVINFLSLDVEGAEIEVLKGIDFDLFIFQLICIETRSFENIKSFLEEKGYILVSRLNDHIGYSDYLFRHTDFKISQSKLNILLDKSID